MPAAPTRRRGVTPLPLRLLLGLGFVLGAAAVVVAVLFGNDRWAMPAALLAALWAVALAAIALEWFRREAQLVAARETEIARTYELELHREVTARREYETALIDTVREETESRHSEDLRSLREQLERLASELSDLMNGDVLVERLTLSAESTRVRGVAGGGYNKRLSALNAADLTEDGFQPALDPSHDGDAVGPERVAVGRAEHAASDPLAHPTDAAGPASNAAGPASNAAGPRTDAAGPANEAVGQASHTPAEPPTDRRPDAPSTSWARRHRQDAARAAAGPPPQRTGGHELDPAGGAEPVADNRISVSELLAAFGSGAGAAPGPHRRRRAED